MFKFKGDIVIPHSLEEYVSLASKDIWEFTKLCSINHPYKEKEEELFNIYDELLRNFVPNTIFDTKVIRENLLRLQAQVYYKNQLNLDKLRKKGKYQVYNNREFFDITGENFILYTHDDEFHPVDDDFTNYDLSDVIKTNNIKNNYICCELASELSYEKLNISKMSVYSLENPTSLIAFGNRDIWIKHTFKPLIQTEDCFVNQYDMAFFNERRHASTEFDFLRYNEFNRIKSSNYIVVNNIDEARKIAEKKQSWANITHGGIGYS